MSQIINTNTSTTQNGTSQTIGSTTSNIIEKDLGSSNKSFIFEAKVIGLESTNPASCGYNIICVAMTDGSSASITGTQDKYIAENAVFSGCDCNFSTSGNSIIVVVKGSTGLTINWKASMTLMEV